MEKILKAKFGGNLKNKLKTTGNTTIIEGNYWHDNFWGSCHCLKCKGKGQNHLGNLLMKIRDNK